MADEDGGVTGGGGDEVKENKDVIVWNYVMFLLAGWFNKFPKEDVMKKAAEVFSKEELKDAKVAFCDNKELTDVASKASRETHTLLDVIYTNWKKLSDVGKLPRFCCDSTSVPNLPMIHPTQQKSPVTEERIMNVEKIVKNVLEQSTTTHTNTVNIDERLGKVVHTMADLVENMSKEMKALVNKVNKNRDTPVINVNPNSQPGVQLSQHRQSQHGTQTCLTPNMSQQDTHTGMVTVRQVFQC